MGRDVAFPCGCVLKRYIHYPGRDWVRTGKARHPCDQHPSPYHAHVELFAKNPTHAVFMGGASPLEETWLHLDGAHVTYMELSDAMAEWVQVARKRAPTLSDAIKLLDSRNQLVLSQERSHVISRDGHLMLVSSRDVAGHSPGDLLTREEMDMSTARGEAKIANFSRSYDNYYTQSRVSDAAVALSMLINTPIKMPKETGATAKKMLADFKENWSEFIYIEARKSSALASYSDAYPEADAKLTYELLKGRTDPPYDTLPVSIATGLTWEQWKDAGVDCVPLLKDKESK